MRYRDYGLVVLTACMLCISAHSLASTNLLDLDFTGDPGTTPLQPGFSEFHATDENSIIKNGVALTLRVTKSFPPSDRLRTFFGPPSAGGTLDVGEFEPLLSDYFFLPSSMLADRIGGGAVKVDFLISGLTPGELYDLTFYDANYTSRFDLFSHIDNFSGVEAQSLLLPEPSSPVARAGTYRVEASLSGEILGQTTDVIGGALSFSGFSLGLVVPEPGGAVLAAFAVFLGSSTTLNRQSRPN